MLGLVLDEPTEKDQVEDVEDLQFILDGELAQGLQTYLPVRVDYDDHYWQGLHVRGTRRSGCG